MTKEDKKSKLNVETVAINIFEDFQVITSIVCPLDDINKAITELNIAVGEKVVFNYLEVFSLKYNLPLSCEDSIKCSDKLTLDFKEFREWKKSMTL